MARKSLWSTGQNRPAKGTTAYMQWQYSVSRGNLLMAIAFTVINLGMLLAGSNSYFLFSISVPYWGALLGDIFGYGDLMVTVAVVLMAVYILCFFLSKKRLWPMAIALVLFVLDSVALIGFTVLGELYADMVLDILMHIWVLFYLVQSIRYGRKLRALGKPLAMPKPAETGPRLDGGEDAGAPAEPARYTGPEIGGKPEDKNSGPEID